MVDCGPWRSMRKSWFAAAALGAAGIAAAAPPCGGGWLALRATIESVEPRDARVVVQGNDGVRREARRLDRLCAGDLVLHDPAVKVDLREFGKRVSVGPGGYRIATMGAVQAAAGTYVDAALDVLGGLRPPVPRAQATAARGDGAAASAERIRGLRALRDLPPQRWTPELALLLAWRGGEAPYRCSVAEASRRELWRSEPTAAAWCELPAPGAAAARAMVDDAHQVGAGWNLRPAAWSDLPRPPWLDEAGATADGPMRTAWAIWLWREGGGEWRLQALAMLQARAAQDALAAELVERILDEHLPTAR